MATPDKKKRLPYVSPKLIRHEQLVDVTLSLDKLGNSQCSLSQQSTCAIGFC